MLGMSVFLGLYAFGFQGIIYGPLLIGLGHTIYEMLNQLTFDENNNLIYETEVTMVVSPDPVIYVSPTKPKN